MKLLIGIVVVVALGIGGFFLLNDYIYNEKQATVAQDFKEAEFVIEGERRKIGDSVNYFGNELSTDLDGDGDEDVAFIVTYEPGGSGTFYYAVVAIKTENGYIGSDGYLLGDRIAPQSTTLSPNSRHENVVVFNYADRAIGEPMTAEPSIGKSAYLKIGAQSMQWGIVIPDFEGESR